MISLEGHPLLHWCAHWGAIAVGGVLGALVRGGMLVAATSLTTGRGRSRATALAILVANLGACALLGALMSGTAGPAGAGAASGPIASGWVGDAGLAFATTGLCGSLSTFSTICADLAQLVRARRLRLGTGYLLAHLVGGPLALTLGIALAR